MRWLFFPALVASVELQAQPGPEAAVVQRFLQLAAQGNSDAMGEIFGNLDGPIYLDHSNSERVCVIANLLSYDSAELYELSRANGVSIVSAKLRLDGASDTVRFHVIQSRDGKFRVSNIPRLAERYARTRTLDFACNGTSARAGYAASVRITIPTGAGDPMDGSCSLRPRDIKNAYGNVFSSLRFSPTACRTDAGEPMSYSRVPIVASTNLRVRNTSASAVITVRIRAPDGALLTDAVLRGSESASAPVGAGIYLVGVGVPASDTSGFTFSISSSQKAGEPFTDGTCRAPTLNMMLEGFGWSLATSDCTRGGGAYARLVTFPVIKPGTFDFTMSSSDFVPYLLLRDATGSIVGAAAPATGSARISLDLTAGLYYIEMSSKAPGVTGNFNVAIQGPPQQ